MTVNFGGHKQAGNGGSFRGSLRAERYFRPNDVVQWTLQGAISQQVVTDFVVDPRIVATDNGWPNVESRVGLGLGRAVEGTRPSYRETDYVAPSVSNTTMIYHFRSRLKF